SRTDFNRDSEKVAWEAFLNLLARARPRCPINGVLLTVSAFDLAVDSEESRQAKARQIQYRLRSIQKNLGIRVPMYLIVTQMERILGFSEFFGALKREEKEQMLGWSNPNPPDVPFSSTRFFQAFDDLSKNLKEQRLERLGDNISQDAAHRAFLLPEEFASMAGPLADYVEILFKENRFAEAPIFRGFYFTGGKEPGSLSTLYSKKLLPANVLESMAQSAETGTPSRSFFINDLFTKKIFLEPGLVTRPRSIFRKNLKIKTVRTLVLGGFILLSALYLFSFTKKSAGEIRILEADIQEARAALVMKKKDTEMLLLCIRLTSDKKRFEQKGFLSRVMGLGRYDLLERKLGVIHRGLFQETVLNNILNKAEKGLDRWQGDRSQGDQDFHLFSAAFIEYTNWSNQTFRLDHPLDIQPFLDFFKLPVKTKYQYLDQFRVYLKEGGRGRRIVDPSSEEIIQRALGASRGYLRPIIQHQYATSAQMSDAQWWLGLAKQLRQSHDTYNALLNTKVPKQKTSAEEMSAQYGELRGLLDQVLSDSHNMLEHIKDGKTMDVLWIDVEEFYKKLLAAGRGWTVVESAVERDRLSVASDFNERVVNTIDRLAPMINSLSAYPSHSWLVDVLSRPFGPDFQAVESDFGVGNMILELLDEVGSYNLLIEDLSTSFGDWREGLPIRIKKLDDFENPLRSAELNLRRDAIQQRRQSLARLATEPFQPKVPTTAKLADIPTAGPEQEKQKEEKRKAVVSFWQVLNLSSRIGQWLEVQDRMRMYIESLYLKEIFNRADFRQGILNAKSWYEIKSMEIFRKGDGVAMVTPINDFLDQWIQYIPQSIRALAKGEAGVKHYPELSGFEKLLKEIMVLQETYMGKLRISANNFAKSIQAMDMDVGVAWQQLRDSPWPNEKIDQLVSWKNLQNLHFFKESLEMEKGPIGRAITSQLEQIETHVFNIYRTELIKMHQSKRKEIFNKYDKLGIADKFPFRVDGPQMADVLLRKFFDDLNSLKDHFELAEGLYRLDPKGKKVPLYSVAQGIVKEMMGERWKRFYEECSNLESFLFKKRTPRVHKFQASMVPGPIGSYFHWARMAFGDGTFKDINVYGEPTAEITMLPKDRSITIQGLDAARMPQVSKEVAKGDYALLQMIYLFGKPMDVERTTWLVDVELPMSENPSFNVESTFKLVFKEGLPILPDWIDTE
ncbi:MAG: type VI secretion system protein, partial [Desulfatiglandales bacterium]